MRTHQEPRRAEAPALTVRAAGQADAGAIAGIYDEGIASGIATFASGPHDAEERRAWLAARPERAPVFVGLVDGEVMAWSALAPFSHRPWYEGVAEYTVYVSGRARGAGLGGRMLRHLIGAAPAHGYWKLVGMILPENGPGLALARGAGFRVVGTHLAHGRIRGEWRDVTVVERHLDAAVPTEEV
jgi:L-amino acid N-acyltransferase YncA